MMNSQRDIVLIPIPFTDLSSSKKRPVVIVSNDVYNESFQDVVVVAITSNLEPIMYSIPIDNAGLEQGHLKVPSLIRSDKIYTLHKEIIVKKLGRISLTTFEKIKKSIAMVID